MSQESTHHVNVVRRIYPNAECVQFGDYTIVTDLYGTLHLLGIGDTEAEAWEDAWLKLQETERILHGAELHTPYRA